jgi:hypothetical protein
LLLRSVAGRIGAVVAVPLNGGCLTHYNYGRINTHSVLWNIFEGVLSACSDVDCYVTIRRLLDYVLSVWWEPNSPYRRYRWPRRSFLPSVRLSTQSIGQFTLIRSVSVPYQSRLVRIREKYVTEPDISERVHYNMATIFF